MCPGNYGLFPFRRFAVRLIRFLTHVHPHDTHGSFQRKETIWGEFCPILIKSIYVMYSNIFISQYRV